MEIPPGPDFPAESFFDVFTELELPDFMPGDTLFNDSPLSIESIVDQMPPYFSPYLLTNAPVTLSNQFGDPAGQITYWREETIPYTQPERFLHVDPHYRPDIAEMDPAGMIRVNMGMAGDLGPDYVTFSWRHHEVPEPFIPFWTDNDGQAEIHGTISPTGEGDGWSGYLDGNTFLPVSLTSSGITGPLRQNL